MISVSSDKGYGPCNLKEDMTSRVSLGMPFMNELLKSIYRQIFSVGRRPYLQQESGYEAGSVLSVQYTPISLPMDKITAHAIQSRDSRTTILPICLRQDSDDSKQILLSNQSLSRGR